MGALGSAKRALLAPLRLLDIAVIRQSSLDRLKNNASDLRGKLRELRVKCFLQAMPKNQTERLRELLDLSKGQLLQDLFVLSELDFKKDGYFVEFGACGGIELSNSYLLETQFGWSGILAEPCRAWHRELASVRRSHISTKCVWSRSGERLSFKESPSLVVSTLGDFAASDDLAYKSARTYDVETISLNDLLAQFNAPREIDYISLDTEGSEFDILSAFDFSKHNFRVITVEHNFTPMREKIYDLLTSNGYARKHEDLSYVDDWYAPA